MSYSLKNRLPYESINQCVSWFFRLFSDHQKSVWCIGCCYKVWSMKVTSTFGSTWNDLQHYPSISDLILYIYNMWHTCMLVLSYTGCHKNYANSGHLGFWKKKDFKNGQNRLLRPHRCKKNRNWEWQFCCHERHSLSRLQGIKIACLVNLLLVSLRW